MIADDLTIEGNLNGEGELHVDGTIRGDVRIDRLTLGETGHIEGAVHADSIEVRGRIIGSITAKVVKLFATAYVDGDITHEQLAMEPGAFFQGRAQKFQRPATAREPAPLMATTVMSTDLMDVKVKLGEVGPIRPGPASPRHAAPATRP